jgi:cytidine deaminase
MAYIFDSLKHPREASLLRSVYGSAFWLVSIVQDISERTTNLAEELASATGDFQAVPEAKALELITRDEADPDAPHGQHVREVFSEADFFLPVQRGEPWRKKVERFFSGVFGEPFLSPYADEEAMRHAQAASLRSAAIGRQVGAVVVPPLGAPYLVGTNEVPKPGGGQYREGDRPDHRDFQSGADPNPAYTRRVIREVMDRLARAEFFTPERNAAGGAAVLREAMTPDDEGKSVLDGARAKSLIEFTRCLHAEQAAIVDAARTGTAIAGARLYTTTFPCHECTKFIVGAGIVEVQYIEPYPKSLAGDLYRDLIDTRPPIEAPFADSADIAKVPFRPFLGFGPTRYDEVFAARERRVGDGVATSVPASAVPVGRGWSELAVRARESEVGLIAGSIVKDLTSRATRDASQDKVKEARGKQEDAS